MRARNTSEAELTVRMHLVLKRGLRLCQRKEWIGSVRGDALITQSSNHERLYKCSTFYSVGKVREKTVMCGSGHEAKTKLAALVRKRLSMGYITANRT